MGLTRSAWHHWEVLKCLDSILTRDFFLMVICQSLVIFFVSSAGRSEQLIASH